MNATTPDYLSIFGTDYGHLITPFRYARSEEPHRREVGYTVQQATELTVAPPPVELNYRLKAEVEKIRSTEPTAFPYLSTMCRQSAVSNYESTGQHAPSQIAVKSPILIQLLHDEPSEPRFNLDTFAPIEQVTPVSDGAITDKVAASDIKSPKNTEMPVVTLHDDNTVLAIHTTAFDNLNNWDDDIGIWEVWSPSPTTPNDYGFAYSNRSTLSTPHPVVEDRPSEANHDISSLGTGGESTMPTGKINTAIVISYQLQGADSDPPANQIVTTASLKPFGANRWSEDKWSLGAFP